MFIKPRGGLDMEVFERCVAAAGDPQFCAFVTQVGGLVVDLATCLEALDAERCYRACLERCVGEGCGGMCLGALETALGVLMARRVARRAEAAALLGLSPVDAVAAAFNEELRKVRLMDCPERGVAARALATAAVDMYMSFREALREQAQDILLLAAPALSAAYKCIGEEVFDYLELMRPFVEEEALKRAVAALEEGAALVGGTLIEFEPVKSKQ